MSKQITLILLVIYGLFSCQNKQTEKQPVADSTSEFTEVINEDYELYIPESNINGVLILFGGYPEDSEDIKREFDILPLAKENNIAVVFSNYNQKLWLEESEKQTLANDLNEIINSHELPVNNIYIGGFSSGGVVTLLISNYINAQDQFTIKPQGVFIIDSPIDLEALYTSSVKNIERDFSEVSVNESTWLIENLGAALGKPEEALINYEKHSIFTYSTANISNLRELINTKIRLYTEPDTLWWKKNRMADYNQTNAYYIEALSEKLRAEGYKDVKYIPTVNRGYRANGDRHPHSWSIVDKKELIEWMLEEDKK